MLKIKDNVTLSELKKYGFKREGTKYIWSTVYNNDYFRNGNTGFEIIVNRNRIIDFSLGLEFNMNDYPSNLINPSVWADDSLNWYLEVLYDLIKDGLVKKAGE